MIAGKTAIEWLTLFKMSHNFIDNSFVQWGWPDGKSGLDQDNLLLEAFSIIHSEAQKQINKKLEQKRK